MTIAGPFCKLDISSHHVPSFQHTKGVKFHGCSLGVTAVCRLNAVREICNRSPLALSADLLHDLVMYKTYKDKSQCLHVMFTGVCI